MLSSGIKKLKNLFARGDHKKLIVKTDTEVKKRTKIKLESSSEEDNEEINVDEVRFLI